MRFNFLFKEHLWWLWAFCSDPGKNWPHTTQMLTKANKLQTSTKEDCTQSIHLSWYHGPNQTVLENICKVSHPHSLSCSSHIKGEHKAGSLEVHRVISLPLWDHPNTWLPYLLPMINIVYIFLPLNACEFALPFQLTWPNDRYLNTGVDYACSRTPHSSLSTVLCIWSSQLQ